SVESTNVFGYTENNYMKSARTGSSCDGFQEDKIDNKIKSENYQENATYGH
ncbi:23999_t:CDS:1, partial [Racocetra persica]